MATVLGLDIRLGREVAAPDLIHVSRPADAVLDARAAWAGLITRALAQDGAHGLLRVRPDGAVDLFDARPASVYAATDRGGTVHLIMLPVQGLAS